MIILTAGATLLGFNTGGFYKSGSLISGPYSPFVMGQVSNALTLAMLVTPLIVNPLTPDNTRQQWALAFYAVASIMVAANIFYVLFASAETQPWAAQEHFKEKRSGSQQSQNSFNKKVFDAENVKRKEKTKW
uniref:Inorganic phosphate cotransporter n=1 Tax=Ditylenchus dipsaci TaxID=166011 RepID=A0A915ESA6_9BILA